MGRDGVAVDAQVAAAVAAFADGTKMNVAARCRELGISTKTFYKYVARFQARGVQGFFPDSRRPWVSPARLSGPWEDVLVTIRKEEDGGGWDYGADAVLMRLEEHPERWPDQRALPSRATINRVFDARGQLAKVPQRRPRSWPRRFERAEVNALWQFDGFDYRLVDETTVCVLQLTDDCSRVDLALQAAKSENGEDVWATFCVAVERYGLPVQQLSDNGNAFSGRRRGWTSDFERRLADLHVQAITSRVSHPQTCGKNERAHQRVQKWLKRRPAAHDLAELQTLLDTYRDQFNTRRNRVLDKLTPHQRFDLGPLALPEPFQEPTHLTRHIISTTGSIGVDGHLVGIGRRHARSQAIAFRTGDYLAVFIDDELTRELIIDRTCHYQAQDR
jgi:transposase InsO family protein